MSVTTYTNPAVPSGGIAKSFTYDSLGNLVTAQLNCCQLKKWNYSAATQYAYPDSVVSGTSPTQLTTSATYSNATGLMLTSTDENNQVTSFGYDSLFRVTTVTRPDSAQVSYTYPTTTQSTFTTTTPIQGTNVQKRIATLDGLGRTIKVTTSDSSSTSYSITEAQYDALGRPYKQSNPHNSTAQYWTTSQFDALGRVKTITLPDNSQTIYVYSNATATVTDPAGKQNEQQYDSLGRLVTAFEPDIANSNALTQQTSYTYNVFDAVTQVTQGAQTRTYVYDALGRLTDSTTPEAGHFNYQYNDFNLVNQRTDARGVITTYGYDTLNRSTGMSYNVGSTGVPATPSVGLTYGTNATQFNNGRLITMTDGVGSENYAYNNLGELTQLQKVISGTTYTTNYAYNLAGEMTQITYPSNRIVQQSFDAIGRLCEIAPSTSGCSTAAAPYATGVGYNTASQVTGFIYGNGVISSYSYSADRLQLTSLSYHNTACASLFLLNFGYAQNGGNNGQITSVANPSQPGQSVNYVYDALARLSSATSVGSSGYSQWGLSFTYDRYGNRTDENQTIGNPPTNHVTFDQTKNRISTSGYAYDANGNLTNDGNNTLVYDAENRAVSVTNGGASGTYTYDGNGLRVKKVSGSTTTVYVFSGSKVIAEYDNGAAVGSPNREYVHSGGALLATIDSAGTRYHHPDQVSTRLTTDSTQNSSAHMGQYPFGEVWYDDGTTTTKAKFTTYERDAESGNDYALARSYVNRLGRFSSPDPLLGSTAVPQTLNRYAYTSNDPINRIDPSGLFTLGPGTGSGGGDPWGPFGPPEFPPPGGPIGPDTGNGGGGPHKPPKPQNCTFNIAINNSSSLGSAAVTAIENRISQIFGATQTPGGDTVGVNFNSTGAPDTTLNLSSGLAGVVASYFNLYGVSTSLTKPTVFTNAVNSNFTGGNDTIYRIDGTFGAHELVHKLGDIRDLGFNGSNPNLMNLDNNPAFRSLVSDPGLPPGLQLTPSQAQKLFDKCKKLHP